MSVVGNEEEEKEKESPATSIGDLSDYELGIVAAMAAGLKPGEPAGIR